MINMTGPAITIDGKKYDADKLSDEAKTQLVNVQACDGELQRLQVQTAIAQTARTVYAQKLQEALAGIEPLTDGDTMQ